MDTLFIEVLNRSITAGYLIFAIIVLRLVWKRAPKVMYCVLWGLVGMRLVMPDMLKSTFSLIPSAEVLEPDILYAASPSVTSGIAVVDTVINPFMKESLTPAIGASVNPIQIILTVMGTVWIIGMVGLLLYGAVSCLRLYYRISDAVVWKENENIYQSEKVSSPFVFGIIHPKIYLPFAWDPADVWYVLLHEKMHIKRRDHLIKILAYLLLAIYWFWPVIWLGYYLFCKDIELACDEAVVKEFSLEEKKSYTKTLVNFSMKKTDYFSGPLAFGEKNVKQRVSNVLRYKKPTIWVSGIVFFIIAAAVICFMADPIEDGSIMKLPDEGITTTYLPEEKTGVIGQKKSEDVTVAEKHYPVETEQKLEVNGVIGTDSNTETEYIVLAEQKEVPELYVTDTLSSMLNYFPLYSNSYEWYYKENGTESGTAATGMFPTLTAKMVDWLRLPEYQGMDTWLYHLNGEIIPDEVVVKEYSIFKLGDQDAEVRSEKTYTKENLLIELIPGRIYELTAVWDTGFYEERGYHGEVSYILVTDTEFATKEDLEKYAVLPKATFTRNAHIKEIYGNRILISSDTDELPGAFEVIIPKEVCDISELQCGQSIVIETFDTGEVNENGKIPVHEAVFLSSFNIVENEKIDLDNFTSD